MLRTNFSRSSNSRTGSALGATGTALSQANGVMVTDGSKTSSSSSYLGVNDGVPERHTAENLVRLRLGTRARRVYWILPARPDATRRLIAAIAHTCGDRLIETRGFTGADGLHLSGQAYRSIAEVFDLP